MLFKNAATFKIAACPLCVGHRTIEKVPCVWFKISFNYKLNPVTNNTNFKDTTARQVVQMPRLHVTLRHVNWH